MSNYTEGNNGGDPDLDLFTVLSSLVSLVGSEQQNAQYLSLFNQIISNEDSLKQSLQMVIDLIKQIPQAVDVDGAKADFAASLIFINDAESAQGTSAQIQSYQQAQTSNGSGLGFFDADDLTNAVSSGLMTLGITQGLFIRRELCRLDSASCGEYKNFAGTQGDDMAQRTLEIESLWDARRTVRLDSGGGYAYVVDGQVQAVSPIDDPYAPIYQRIQSDRDNELHPIVDPLYQSVISILKIDSKFRLARFPGSGRIWCVINDRACWVDSSATLMKWFGIAESDSSIVSDSNVLVGPPIGGNITQDIAPAYACTQDWSFTAAARYGIYLPCCPPPSESGRLVTGPPGPIWWLENGRLHWVGSPTILEHYFPGAPVTPISMSEHDTYDISNNIDQIQ